jgi:NTE family protein
MNQPMDATVAMTESPAYRAAAVSRGSTGLMLIVSFSGGGTRAAALAYGVLDKLKNTRVIWEGRETSLADQIYLVSGVSGGSIAAAYFVASGGAFEDLKGKFLNYDFESDLLTAAMEPAGAFHLTSPWYGRGNLLADEFDRVLFHGVTYGQVLARRLRPILVITATDLSLGTTFEFSERQFRQICSEIGTLPVAVAVAASNSVPIIFTPTTLRNYTGSCPIEPSSTIEVAGTPRSGAGRQPSVEEQDLYKDWHSRPFLHLVDGGLVDNLGLRRFVDGVAAAGGLARSLQSKGISGIHKIVFLTVDAGRRNSFEADRVDSIPSTMDVARGIQFGLLSHYSAETSETFAKEIGKWRTEVRTDASEGTGPFASDADLYYIAVRLQDYSDPATRAKLLSIPTAYTLEEGQVQELIDAGHELLDSNDEFKRLVTDLGGPSKPTTPNSNVRFPED